MACHVRLIRRSCSQGFPECTATCLASEMDIFRLKQSIRRVGGPAEEHFQRMGAAMGLVEEQHFLQNGVKHRTCGVKDGTSISGASAVREQLRLGVECRLVAWTVVTEVYLTDLLQVLSRRWMARHALWKEATDISRRIRRHTPRTKVGTSVKRRGSRTQFRWKESASIHKKCWRWSKRDPKQKNDHSCQSHPHTGSTFPYIHGLRHGRFCTPPWQACSVTKCCDVECKGSWSSAERV